MNTRAMGAVSWGIRLVFVGVLATLLGILLAVAINLKWIPAEFAALSVVCLIGGAANNVVGPLVCLAVPRATSARPMILISVLLQLANLGVKIVAQVGVEMPPIAAMLGTFTGFLALMFFILFLKSLSSHLERDDLDADADATITSLIGLAVCFMLMLVPIIGCVAIFAVVGFGVAFLARYVQLLAHVSSAVKDSLGEANRGNSSL